jgi:hypothetical protein
MTTSTSHQRQFAREPLHFAAVHLLRQQGGKLLFPDANRQWEIISAMGNDFILTAEQVLDLLDRGDLHTERLIRLVGAQAVQQREPGASTRTGTTSSYTAQLMPIVTSSTPVEVALS